MKGKLFLLLLPLVFISCATMQKTAVSENTPKSLIYYHEAMNDIMLAVRGEVLADGSFRVLYPGTPGYENAKILEVTVKEVPSYYVFDKKTMSATKYDVESNNEEKLVLKKSETKEVEILNFRLNYASPGDTELKSSILLVDKSKKLRPEKFGSKNLIGTWMDSATENPRRRFTFTDKDVFVDENYKEDEFYQKHFYPYRKLTDNIISVQIDTISKISGKMTCDVNLYYYDGSFLYDIIFPLKDVSNDKEILESLGKLK